MNEIKLSNPIEIEVLEPKNAVNSSILDENLYYILKHYSDLLVLMYDGIKYTHSTFFDEDLKNKSLEKRQLMQEEMNKIIEISYIPEKKEECISRYCKFVNKLKIEVVDVFNDIENKMILN